MRTPTLLALLALASISFGCDKPPEGGSGPSTTSATTASAATLATTRAATSVVPAGSTAPATAASASGEPASEGPAGTVRIHLDGAKVVTGKADTAEKSLKSNMLKLRTECVAPAIKKQAPIDGTLKVVLELGPDGKVTKATTTVPTGKVPDEVASCVKGFYEKNIELDTNKAKAKVEATIAMGPNVQSDK